MSLNEAEVLSLLVDAEAKLQTYQYLPTDRASWKFITELICSLTGSHEPDVYDVCLGRMSTLVMSVSICVGDLFADLNTCYEIPIDLIMALQAGAAEFTTFEEPEISFCTKIVRFSMKK